jgi:SAM-dependent methyltransferase
VSATLSNVHELTKSEIKKFAVQKRDSGQFFDRSAPHLEDNFIGSIDRFCDIAVAFRAHQKVLDAGSGDGLLLALLKMLGHTVYAVDFVDHTDDPTYIKHSIPFWVCNLEADTIPFETGSMDAVSCCQALEHFTHSPLPVIQEFRRVLRAGGLLEIDVPNVASYRNRSRLLRGKHITYDYEKHYLDADPIPYKGREYYPNRHNREFTAKELDLLLRRGGFADVRVDFLKSLRYREGLAGLISFGTMIKNLVPGMRKSLIAFAKK